MKFLYQLPSDAALYGSMSMVLAYWMLACFGGMSAFCYKHWWRIKNWSSIQPIERADATLNWGLALFFLYAFVQRSTATYIFFKAAFSIPPTFAVIGLIFLPVALVSMSLVLWWLCYQWHRPKRRWWWCLFMWSGVLLGVTTFAVLHA